MGTMHPKLLAATLPTVFLLLLFCVPLTFAEDNEACNPNSGGSDANWGAILDDARQKLDVYGASASLLKPFGAEIRGLRLGGLVQSGELKHGDPLATSLELLMSHVGVLVFADQGLMSPSDQIGASALFGAGELHSTHGEHAKAGSEHIFRLSSSGSEGIVGPGAEWHCDGSFLEDVFSHAGYHIVQLPENHPTGTSFAHLGHAYDMLSEEEKGMLQSMASVNSNGGAVHPLVHTHPLSGRPSLFLHLAMTGAVVHVPDSEENSTSAQWAKVTALDEEEMVSLFQRVSALLNHPDVALHHQYRPGDFVVVDNWAAAHRAFPGSFDPSRGVRIVHRTTVKSPRRLAAPSHWRLPAEFEQTRDPPKSFRASAPHRRPVWVDGYLGFRWRACEAIDLAGERSSGQVQMQTPCYTPTELEDVVGGRGFRWAGTDLSGVWMRVAQA